MWKRSQPSLKRANEEAVFSEECSGKKAEDVEMLLVPEHESQEAQGKD